MDDFFTKPSIDGNEFPSLGAAPTTDDICTAIREGRWRGTDTTKSALKVLFDMKHVEQFSFGPLKLETIREAQSEALEFIEYGCFDLPYPECIYRCTIEFDNKPVGFHIFAVRKAIKGGEENCIATLGTIHSSTHVLTFRSDNLLKLVDTSRGKGLQVTVPTHEVKFWEPYIGEIPRSGWLSGNVEILTEASLLVTGLTMILNTKGVLKERSAPPRKPNIARAKAGRPLLPYVTRVYTNVYNRAIQPGTGTHASPRPHRRRAHVRHYPKTNTREAYSIPIAAMLVNWDGKPLEERKEYVAK